MRRNRETWKALVAEVTTMLNLDNMQKDEFAAKASVKYWDDLADGIQAEEIEK